MSARVLRFRSREEHKDADRVRDALRGIALECTHIVNFAEPRGRAADVKAAQRIKDLVLDHLEAVKP